MIAPPQLTNYPQPPLGIAMIAAILENNGYSVKIIDMPALGLTIEHISAILRSEKPNIVGITSVTPTINSAISLTKKIKEIDPKIIVILGGPHATILPEEILRNVSEIDFIIRGEGEKAIVELIKTLDNKPKKIVNQVQGITCRDGLKILSTSSRPPILELDELPFPAFHLLPIKNYRPHPPFGKRNPFMTIVTSRGCPYNCIFCSKSVFGKKYRTNSVRYIVDEIKFLADEFNVKEIKFYDDVFTINKKWVIELCRMLREENMDMPWTCETRVNLVSEDLLIEMKAAGCYMISYGVESGNQTILNKLNKNITLDQALKAFKITNESGINTVGYFMIGCPEESPETMMDTIRFAKKLDPDFVQFSIATPYPGTALHRLAVEEGFLPQKWDQYVYADLKTLDNSSFGIKTLSRRELAEWNSKAYLSFYLRWTYVWKRLRNTKSLGDLKTNIAGLRMLLEATL